MRNKLVALAAVFILSLILRLVLLESRPLGFTWDEAALGYNAYSLLKTGRDEYGQFMPLVFKSFGDYKPGLYIYFNVLPVKIFGLSVFATRLSSALFGSLSVLLAFLFARQLFPRDNNMPLISAFLLAISPWAIHFSRGAWEANLCLFLALLGSVLFLGKKHFLSAVFFALSLYAYQGAKLFIPLLIAGLFLFQKLPFKKIPLILLPLALAALPMVLGLSEQSGRLKVYSVFSYTRSSQSIESLMRQDNIRQANLLFLLFHAEIIDQGRGVAQRFLNYLSPKFLFVAGDWSNSRHAIPYQGYFYYPELVVLLLGIAVAIKKYSSSVMLLFYWIFIAILPAAFSRDIITGVRSLPLVVPLVMLCSLGLAALMKHKKIVLLWLASLLFFFVYFLDLYFIHLPKIYKEAWLQAYQPVVKLVASQQSQYQDIYFSDKLGQPYIFVLFFTKADPAQYQKNAHLSEDSQGDVGKVTQFGKYHFGPIYWPSMRAYKSSLFIGDVYELPEKDLNISNLENYGYIEPFRVAGLI